MLTNKYHRLHQSAAALAQTGALQDIKPVKPVVEDDDQTWACAVQARFVSTSNWTVIPGGMIRVPHYPWWPPI